MTFRTTARRGWVGKRQQILGRGFFLTPWLQRAGSEGGRRKRKGKRRRDASLGRKADALRLPFPRWTF